MQYYDNEQNKKHGRLAGLLAVLLYLVFFFAVALLVRFTAVDAAERHYGMLVDFGVTEWGMGDEEVAMSDDVSLPVAGAFSEDMTLTQNTDMDAPEIFQPTEENRLNTSNNSNSRDAGTATETRQVNPDAIFPGRGSGDSSSDGTGNTPGNQGNPSGVAGGSRDGTGIGNSGVESYSLAGRSPVGNLTKPSYNANVQGRVVVDVIVDEHGKVTSATFKGQGSTTQDPELVRAAIDAARKSTFNEVAGADPQKGTITYNFKLE